MEMDQSLADSACGGTHRMVGVSMALNRHLAEGGELIGIWKEADDKLRDCIEKAQRNQQPNGTLSTNYFERPGNSPDIGVQINATGHTLELLTYAMTTEQLREPWVVRAVERLCDLFEMTRHETVECGRLYHAAHGLVLYRHRVFGPAEYTADLMPEDEAPVQQAAVAVDDATQ